MKKKTFRIFIIIFPLILILFAFQYSLRILMWYSDKLYSEAKYAKCISLLNHTPHLFHNDANFLTRRGFAFLMLDSLEAAIDDFKKSIQLDSSQASSYLGYGNAAFKYSLVDKNIARKALTNLSRSIELDSSLTEVYLKIGMLYQDAFGSSDSSLYYLHKAIKLDSTQGIAYRYIAFNSFNKGNYDVAIDQYTKAIHFDTLDIKAYLLRAVTNLKIGDTTQYCNDILNAKDLDSKYILAKEAGIKDVNIPDFCVK